MPRSFAGARAVYSGRRAAYGRLVARAEFTPACSDRPTRFLVGLRRCACSASRLQCAAAYGRLPRSACRLQPLKRRPPSTLQRATLLMHFCHGPRTYQPPSPRSVAISRYYHSAARAPRHRRRRRRLRGSDLRSTPPRVTRWWNAPELYCGGQAFNGRAVAARSGSDRLSCRHCSFAGVRNDGRAFPRHYRAQRKMGPWPAGLLVQDR